MKSTEKQYIFKGNFADLCERFIRQKRALGYKYRTEPLIMVQFDRFSMGYGTRALTKKIVTDFISRKPGQSKKTCEIRISVIRQFGLFLLSQGYDAYLPPPKKYSLTKSFVPYIFTHEEISKIFRVSDNIKKNTGSPYMHLVIPVLFRMLYGCGLRLSEALNLRNKDVNLKEGILTIKNAKFDNDRLVPMSLSMLKICQRYANIINSDKKSKNYFFPAPDKTRIDISTIYSRFREVLWKSGISHGGRGKGPRLHDFRHTFAVRSLQKWVSKKIDIYNALPVLSTYLGHRSIAGTQRYLHLTAEVYPEIISAVEGISTMVFPEVKES